MFAIKKSLRHCNQQMRILWSIKTVQLAQLNCFCHWLRVHIESCEVELASNRLQLPLMASLNDKISPQAQFSEESWTSLSTQKFSMEIASPTVEDHILDFALLYRRNQNDGQLILLSEDVTLKIKCMAEVSSYLYNMLLSYYSTREMLGTHTLPHSFKHFH